MLKYNASLKNETGYYMSKKKTQFQDVIIIGAGASGMMAAITAARRGLSVLLLEHMDKPGKKLLATGNGKCNFTNQKMSADCYYGNRALIETVLSSFSVEKTLSFFREIGIWPKEKNGYYYPNSGQAASVTEALAAELKRCGVTLYTSCQISGVAETKYGFEVTSSLGRFAGRNLLYATGLRAAPKLGSDGSAFFVLKEFGHRFVPILPALCGFEASGIEFRKVSGVRTDADLTLYIDQKAQKSERGELQLADYGVSGIPVFQLSSPAVRALHDKKEVQIQIDFLPDFSKEALASELKRRFQRDAGYQPIEASLRGLLNQKLIPVLLKTAQLNVSADGESLTNEEQKRLCSAIKNCRVTLKTVRDFSFAQVCTGGIRTEEINIQTLESRIVPGLYFAGELLDVDGICGGYNLQWAWASGFVAGSAVGNYD